MEGSNNSQQPSRMPRNQSMQSIVAAAAAAALADGLEIKSNDGYEAEDVGLNIGETEADDAKARKSSALRRGKWTGEEEAYANRLIHEFKSGLLPLTDGTTLRTFLSIMLNCDPMRISKKFVGSNCIGKQVFRRRQADIDALSPAEVERSRADLATLERRFLERVQTAGGGRAARPAGGGTPAGSAGGSSSGGGGVAQSKKVRSPRAAPVRESPRERHKQEQANSNNKNAQPQATNGGSAEPPSWGSWPGTEESAGIKQPQQKQSGQHPPKAKYDDDVKRAAMQLTQRSPTPQQSGSQLQAQHSQASNQLRSMMSHMPQWSMHQQHGGSGSNKDGNLVVGYFEHDGMPHAQSLNSLSHASMSGSTSMQDLVMLLTPGGVGSGGMNHGMHHPMQMGHHRPMQQHFNSGGFGGLHGIIGGGVHGMYGVDHHRPNLGGMVPPSHMYGHHNGDSSGMHSSMPAPLYGGSHQSQQNSNSNALTTASGPSSQNLSQEGLEGLLAAAQLAGYNPKNIDNVRRISSEAIMMGRSTSEADFLSLLADTEGGEEHAGMHSYGPGLPIFGSHSQSSNSINQDHRQSPSPPPQQTLEQQPSQQIQSQSASSDIPNPNPNPRDNHPVKPAEGVGDTHPSGSGLHLSAPYTAVNHNGKRIHPMSSIEEEHRTERQGSGTSQHSNPNFNSNSSSQNGDEERSSRSFSREQEYVDRGGASTDAPGEGGEPQPKRSKPDLQPDFSHT